LGEGPSGGGPGSGSVDWLTLCILAAVWGILLVPPRKKRQMTPTASAGSPPPADFHPPGRWILTLTGGSRLVGPFARTRMRARGRRRRVYLFLLEAIGVTGLIGLFPPLRGMLVVTGILAVLLVAYTAMVLRYGAVRPAAGSPDRVVVIPERAEQDPSLEEEHRRLVRVASR
jgi:hypothetical protein